MADTPRPLADLSEREILDRLRLWLMRTNEVVRGESGEGHYLRTFFERCEPAALMDGIEELRSRHG